MSKIISLDTDYNLIKKEYDLFKNKLIKSMLFIKNIREQNNNNKYKNPKLYIDINMEYVYNIEYCIYNSLKNLIENENNKNYSFDNLNKISYNLDEKLSQKLNYIIKDTNTYLFIKSELKKQPLSLKVQLLNVFFKHFQLYSYCDYEFESNI